MLFNSEIVIFSEYCFVYSNLLLREWVKIKMEIIWLEVGKQIA